MGVLVNLGIGLLIVAVAVSMFYMLAKQIKKDNSKDGQ